MNSSAYEAGQVVGTIIGMALGFGIMAFALLSIIMACVKRTRGWIICACIFGLLGLAGIGAGAYFGFQAAMQAAKPKEITSQNGRVKLSVPGSWSELRELPAEAGIRYGNGIAEQYCLEMEEELEMGLEQYGEILSGQLRDTMENARVSPPEPFKAGSIQGQVYAMSGKSQGLGISYRLYLFPVQEHSGTKVMHRLVMWTLAGRESSARGHFDQVAASFRPVLTAK